MPAASASATFISTASTPSSRRPGGRGVELPEALSAALLERRSEA
ncbi:MAG: hypothetical protein M5U34_21430 [Chloroflexi bacterium]|nr:hypothetical protein [Chloroflexota bacterium]